MAYLTYSQFFHWTGRRGKKGHPICFFDFDCLDKRALARWDTSRTTAYWNYSQTDTALPNPHMLQLTSVFVDSISRFVMPLCSMLPDRAGQSASISSSIYLADGSQIGLKMAWNAKSFAQEVSGLLSTSYPETIEKIFVGNDKSWATNGALTIFSTGLQFSFVLSNSLEVYKTLHRSYHSTEDCFFASVRGYSHAEGVYR